MAKQIAIPTIVQWNNVDLSHHHLDHISEYQMKQLHENNIVKGLKSYDVKILSLYKACLLGKKIVIINEKGTPTSDILGIVHSFFFVDQYNLQWIIMDQNILLFL